MLRSKLSRNIFLGALAAGTAGGTYTYWIRNKSTDESKLKNSFMSKMSNSLDCQCECVCSDLTKSAEVLRKKSNLLTMKDEEKLGQKNWRSSFNLQGDQFQGSTTKSSNEKRPADESQEKIEDDQKRSSSWLPTIIPQSEKIQTEKVPLRTDTDKKVEPLTSGSSSWLGGLFSAEESTKSLAKSGDLKMTTSEMSQSELSKDVDKKEAEKENCKCDCSKSAGSNEKKAEHNSEDSISWLTNLLSVGEKPVDDEEAKNPEVKPEVSKKVEPSKNKETIKERKETPSIWFSSSKSPEEINADSTIVDPAKCKEVPEEKDETSNSWLGGLFSTVDEESDEDSNKIKGSGKRTNHQKKNDSKASEEKEVDTYKPESKSLLSSIFLVGDDSESENNKKVGSTKEKPTCDNVEGTNKEVKVDEPGWFASLFSNTENTQDDSKETKKNVLPKSSELVSSLKNQNKDGKKPQEADIQTKAKSKAEVSQSGSWLGSLFSMTDNVDEATAQKPPTLPEAEKMIISTEDVSKMKEVESSSWFSWFSSSDSKAKKSEDNSINIHVYPQDPDNDDTSSKTNKDSDNYNWIGVIFLQGDTTKENKSQLMAKIIVDDKSAKAVRF